MINNITLMGRLTRDPELKTTTNGTSLTNFCIAVDRNYQSKDGEKQTDFINCVAWRQTAEFISRYFGQGDMIAVTGELQTRKYEDKDGNNRTIYEVVVGHSSFCGGKATTMSLSSISNAKSEKSGNSGSTTTQRRFVRKETTSAIEDWDPDDNEQDLPF